VDAGINSPIDGVNYIVNNIVANVTERLGSSVFLEQPSAPQRATMHHNLFGADARIRWGSDRAWTLADAHSPFASRRFPNLAADPVFVNPTRDDFHLAHDSPGITGASSEPGALAARYRELYGVDLPADFGVMGAFDEFSRQPRRPTGWFQLRSGASAVPDP